MAMITVLVTGIRGKTGRQVAAALLGRGNVTVRGVSRSVADIAPFNTMHMDWEDPKTWGPSLTGVDAVYIVKPRTDPAQTVAAFLDLASEVRRVVLLSEIDAGNRPASTPEREAETVIQHSSFEWTILRPNWFMQNFTEPSFYLEAVRDVGELRIPSGGGATSIVDTRDIGEAAAACLVSPGHAGRVYELTGPEAFSWRQIAYTLSDAAGHRVSHVDVPLEAYLVASAERGMSDASLDYYRRIYSSIRDGRTAGVSSHLAEITGHPPRSFGAFVAEHRELWRR